MFGFDRPPIARYAIAAAAMAVVALILMGVAARQALAQIYSDHECVYGVGTPCPRQTDPSFCPPTYSVGNYYCSSVSLPSDCQSRLDMGCYHHPANSGEPGLSNGCGDKKDCLHHTIYTNPDGSNIPCTQTRSYCVPIALP